jgi:hypothetical protein
MGGSIPGQEVGMGPRFMGFSGTGHGLVPVLHAQARSLHVDRQNEGTGASQAQEGNKVSGALRITLARETLVEPETSDGIPDEMISFKIKELVKIILFTAIGYTKAKCVRKSVIKIGLIIQKWIATF